TPTRAAWPHSAPTPQPGSGFPARGFRGSPSSFPRSSVPPRSPRPGGPPHRTPTPPSSAAEPEDPTKPAPHSKRVPAPGAQSASPETHRRPEVRSQSAPKLHSQECVPWGTSFAYSTSPNAFLGDLRRLGGEIAFRLR